MNKPLLLTIASDSGYPLNPIIIDMEKIVAMYEEDIPDRQERGKVNKITKLLPTAGRHLQVVEGMNEIMLQLFAPQSISEEDARIMVEGDPSIPTPQQNIYGSVLIETHRCANCDADCIGENGVHQCDQCPAEHEA